MAEFTKEQLLAKAKEYFTTKPLTINQKNKEGVTSKIVFPSIEKCNVNGLPVNFVANMVLTEFITILFQPDAIDPFKELMKDVNLPSDFNQDEQSPNR